MQIIPAILEKNPDDLFAQVHKLSFYFNRFQIDIQDGIFISNKTLSIDNLLVFFSNHQPPITNHQLTFDFHLMVSDYEGEIKKLDVLRNFINIKTVLLHFSLSPHQSLFTNRQSPSSFGLVLNPQDSVDEIAGRYDLQTIPSIQIMSIYPGPQGQSFIPETLHKIEQFSELGYKGKIFLDGGINEQTVPLIIALRHKPDALCVGSYLTHTKNVEKPIQYLFEKCGFEGIVRLLA